MSAAPWSGALAIGVGWAALDARLGKNTAHAHLAHQVILGLDGAVVVTTNSDIIAPKARLFKSLLGRPIPSVLRDA